MNQHLSEGCATILLRPRKMLGLAQKRKSPQKRNAKRRKQSSAGHRKALQGGARCRRALKGIAGHCKALQGDAMCRRVLQGIAGRRGNSKRQRKRTSMLRNREEFTNGAQNRVSPFTRAPLATSWRCARCFAATRCGGRGRGNAFWTEKPLQCVQKQLLPFLRFEAFPNDSKGCF